VRVLLRWALLGGLVALVGWGMSSAGVPSASLFAALVVGIAYALLTGHRMEMPRVSILFAQATIGVIIGTHVQGETLRGIGAHWFPLSLVCVITLALTVVGGLVLARWTGVDRATAAFGMIAGGASGIIAISRELGADDRLVAVMQYLRVLLVVVLTPVVATTLFGLTNDARPSAVAGHQHWLAGVAFLLAVSLVGVLAGRLVRLPTAGLLGPLVLASALTLAGSSLVRPVPDAVQALAFALIGLQIGLRFTPASMMQAGRLLPAATVLILGLILVCALLALALAPLAHVSRLDAYLATSPGGLYAVLAIALGGNVNAPFVLSVQLLRTLVMLLAAPPLARWLLRRGPVSETLG
jgi:uncharacterized protein